MNHIHPSQKSMAKNHSSIGANSKMHIECHPVSTCTFLHVLSLPSDSCNPDDINGSKTINHKNTSQYINHQIFDRSSFISQLYNMPTVDVSQIYHIIYQMIQLSILHSRYIINHRLHCHIIHMWYVFNPPYIIYVSNKSITAHYTIYHINPP